MYAIAPRSNAINRHSGFVPRPANACTSIHSTIAIAPLANAIDQNPVGMLKWSIEGGANMNAIPIAIATWPVCHQRRCPSLWRTCRAWLAMITKNTSVQITASQFGRMFVVLPPTLIETPPIASECIPPPCDAAVDPMWAMLGILELDDELPFIVIALDPSAAAAPANRSATASNPTANASVCLQPR